MSWNEILNEMSWNELKWVEMKYLMKRNEMSWNELKWNIKWNELI